MTSETAYEAVIADLDGVLARIGALHERAWQVLFDDYLERWEERHGQALRRVTGEDCRGLVDAKSPQQGIEDFLKSRQIGVLAGEVSEPSGAETVTSLAKRKREVFLKFLEEEGLHALEYGAAALDRWRRSGLKLAAVSNKREFARTLRLAGLGSSFEHVVALAAEEASTVGKVELLRAALQRVATAPERTVVLQDSAAGVRAARELGLGFIVGVAWADGAAELMQAGAHQVVQRLYQARFLRTLPPALWHLQELASRFAGRRLAVLLDYDGTLTPIVSDPRAAVLSKEMRALVAELAEVHTVAVVSGRDRADVQARVGIPGLCYAGSHGFDIAGPGHHKTLPEAELAVPLVEQAVQALETSVGTIPGVVLERKRFSVAVHYRMVVDPADVDAVRSEVAVLAERTGLRQRTGKKVLELEPAVDWHKGRAVTWLLSVLRLDPEQTVPLYIGDDDTDEDAFEALCGVGLGIRVGDAVAASLADYRLADPSDVAALLRWLVGHRA